MNKNYITIKVAKYALTELLHSLMICGINEITVTTEDKNLVVTLSKEDLDKAIYNNETKEKNDNFCEYILNTNKYDTTRL